MFAGLFLILCGWAFLAIVYVGVGRLWVGADAPPLRTAFWLGFGTLLIALQLWHLALPVSGATAVVAVAVAAVGLWRSRGALTGQLRALARDWPPLLVGAVAASLIACAALGPPGNADSGVYHLPAVRWAQAFRVLPGLVNVHPFLGVNHGYLLLEALGDVGPFHGQVQHFSNSLLVVALVAQAVYGFVAVVRGRLTVVTVFDALMVVPAAYLVGGNDLGSFSSDPAEVALTAAAVSLYLAWATTPRDRGAIQVFLPAVALAVVKLSSACAAVGLSLALLWLVRSRGGALAPLMKRMAVIGVVGLGAWSANSLIRSGYLPFPGALVRAGTDWAALPQLESRLREYTVGYSRGTQYVAPNAPWIGPWALRVGSSGPWIQVAALLTLLAAAAHVALGSYRAAALALPIVAQLGFWFFTAPDERYLGGWHWALAGTLAATAVGAIQSERVRRRAALAVLCIAAATAIGLASSLGLRRYDGLQPPPTVAYAFAQTKFGLRVTVVEGLACWDAPLPCVAPFEPWLKTRGPNLEAGFALDPPDRATYHPAATLLMGKVPSAEQ